MFGWLKKTETTAEVAPEQRDSTLAYPDQWFAELFGAVPATSGVSVSPTNAMKCAPVRCAVQTIAEACGQLPLMVYRRGSDGSRERAPDHAVYALAHDEVNDWTSAQAFREQLVRDALLWGDGLALIVRDGSGQPRELHRLDPSALQVERDRLTAEPTYRLTGPEPRVLSRHDVIHIMAPSLDGLHGLSPVREGREAIGVALALEAHAGRLFLNGCRPSGILSFPQRLGAEVAKRIKLSWQAATGGSNSGGTAVLEEGGAFTPLAFSSVDAQFLEMRKFAVEEIGRIFRISPVLLQDLGRATWANSEEMGRQFIAYTLMPWLKRIEAEFRLKLFTVEERQTLHVEFLTDDFARADLAARMTAYSTAIAARILSPNEARAAENRPPYAGGDRFENPNTTTNGGGSDA